MSSLKYQTKREETHADLRKLFCPQRVHEKDTSVFWIESGIFYSPGLSRRQRKVCVSGLM